MKKIGIFMLSVFVTLFFAACGGGGGGGTSDGSGTVSLYMTDAPLLDENVTGVYVTIDAIEYQRKGGWKEFTGFEGPKTVNLLELQNGRRIKLLEATLPEGEYRLRFDLDADRCRIEFDDDENRTLFVPSGRIHVNGSVSVTNGRVDATVDFDLHKSVLKTGHGYQLKPFLRVARDATAGSIEGNITNIADYDPALDRLIVYAYRIGSYDENESLPDDEGERFTGAISSAKVNMKTGGFVLAYLPEGRYDLVLVRYVDYDFGEVLGLKCGVRVHHGIDEITIDTTDLEVECVVPGCEVMENVQGIFLHVTAIRYKLEGAPWHEAKDFNGSATYDLLKLQSDEGMPLAGVTLPAGHYSEIRLILGDMIRHKHSLQSNEGSYILYDDNTSANLRVPSGERSGYKLKVDFELEEESNVTLKTPLSLCEILHETGNGKVMLRPTLRIEQAIVPGAIEGRVVDIADFNTTRDRLVVYAYGEGDYHATEETPDDAGNRFTRAEATADVDMRDGKFAFVNLFPKSYDLAVVKYENGDFSEMLGLQKGVKVDESETTTVDINTSLLTNF